MSIKQIYDELSYDYETKYVDGISNCYKFDESAAAGHFKNANISGRIISLGVGSGQDIEILNYPDPTNFVGVDFSIGMIENGRRKFPNYTFGLHDCNLMLNSYGEFDILVSMFGTANYIGTAKLLNHYTALKCSKAFFVFYKEDYDDNLVKNYHRYSPTDLAVAFQKYNAHIMDLWKGSNYYVVWWDESF